MPAPRADARPADELRTTEGRSDARLADRPLRPSPMGTPIPEFAADSAAAILEGIGQAIVVIDAQTRVTWWNAAAERATGVCREDVLERRIFDRFPRLAGTVAEHILADVIAKREAREYSGWHFRGATSDSVGIYDARLWPLADGGVLLLFADVTTRETQRRALELQKQELEARVRENEELRDFARKMAGIAD